jgi:prepilin-type N-terminal cleavage/methylation domain-containing protein
MTFERALCCCAVMLSGMSIPQRDPSRSVRQARRSQAGFSLTELLVSVSVILMLMSLLAAAISTAKSSHRHLATASLITKLNGVIAAQYGAYASLNVDASSASARGARLREIATGDLPDSWAVVEQLAAKPTADLTPAQRAYTAIWNAVENKPLVTQEHSGAECLFMIVMQGGIADCLDCRGLRTDIGDVDGDEMPEFLDAWGSPIGFVLWPSDLELPAGEAQPFFSAKLPFDEVLPEQGEAAGGLMRPLIVSAGPDREFGLDANAGPLAGSSAANDNITNFDEEVRR